VVGWFPPSPWCFSPCHHHGSRQSQHLRLKLRWNNRCRGVDRVKTSPFVSHLRTAPSLAAGPALPSRYQPGYGPRPDTTMSCTLRCNRPVSTLTSEKTWLPNRSSDCPQYFFGFPIRHPKA
jgi:hypothetical protein